MLKKQLLKSNFYNIQSNNNAITIIISDQYADALFDQITLELDLHGFDHEGNPTQEGILLEHLIDKLS